MNKNKCQHTVISYVDLLFSYNAAKGYGPSGLKQLKGKYSFLFNFFHLSKKLILRKSCNPPFKVPKGLAHPSVLFCEFAAFAVRLQPSST